MATTNKQKWMYSIANLGNVIPYQASNFVLFFFTDVKRLPVQWASTAMLIFAFYNALNNPVTGYISDRTHSRWGRRIPYILFGTAPYVVTFALIWMAPFDGVAQPVPLLLWMIFTVFIWEGFGTAVSTGYYSLLPEMFSSYEERTSVAVSMNQVQTVGLLIGVALPPILYSNLGWPAMGWIFAVIAAAAMYYGVRGMFEREKSQIAESVPFAEALRATFVNRSFVTVVIAQTLRFFATGILSTGVAFYIKYSLGADDSMAAAILATAFVTAGIMLWPWRKWVASRFEARTTLMIAYVVTAISVIPLGLVRNIGGAIAAAAGIGVGLAGLILMGDVILADVIDEDETKTGQRREGMYFGMSGLIITLSSALVAQVFGILAPAYGYDPALAVQPETVGTGFRIFMSVPPLIGSLLAVLALTFYPLHGKKLQEVKAKLASGSMETIA